MDKLKHQSVIITTAYSGMENWEELEDTKRACRDTARNAATTAENKPVCHVQVYIESAEGEVRMKAHKE